MTNASSVTNRVRAIAADYDLEADQLYAKARRGGPCASAVQGEASGRRRDASFLRELADGLERLPADLGDELAAAIRE